MPWRTLAALSWMVAQAVPANAFCWYGGVDNAHISMNREFADSRWVVRARVLAAKDGETASGPNSGEGWTAYRLQVLRAYKGQPPSRLNFFTDRDSGGFYMDKPGVDLPKGHDIGGEYLLFLNPNAAYRDEPAAARGSVFVNYNCGQSREWPKVTAREKLLLERLGGLKRAHRLKAVSEPD